MAHDSSDGSLHGSPTAAQSQAAQLAFTLGSMLGLPGMGGALGLSGMGGLPQLPGVGVGLSPMHAHDYAAHSPYGHVDVMSPARGYMQHQPPISGGSGGGGGHGAARPKKAATPRRNAGDAMGGPAELGEDGQPKKKKRAPRKSDALGADGAPAPKKRKSKAPELDANGVPIAAPPRVRKKKAAAAAAGGAEGDEAGGPEAPGSGGKKRGPKRNVGVGLPYAAAGAFNAGPLAGASYPAMGAALPGEGIGMAAGGGWDLSALHPGGRGAMAASAPPAVQIGRVAGPFHPDSQCSTKPWPLRNRARAMSFCCHCSSSLVSLCALRMVVLFCPHCPVSALQSCS